jgi:AraC-like DNA-binding protein
MQASHQIAVHPTIASLKCISTEGVRASERREFWRTNVAPVFGSLEVQFTGSELFNASFEYTEVADLVFSRLTSPVPHRVVRAGTAARHDNRSFVKAVLLTGGRSILEQNGRMTPLRVGEWSIYDTAQPYSMTIPDRAEMLFLLMPREKLLTRSLDLQDLLARRFSGRRGVGKLIWSLISNTFDQIPAMGHRSSLEVADIVVQMTRLALIDFSGERSSTDSREALRDRVKLYIASHLGDPDLSISKLASVTGCTKRYLHMTFQQEDVSISDYILRLRLERCREDLLDPAYAHKSITDIAYAWGFNNSNHFSRCFKQAFGTSPRHSRAECADWLTASPEKHLKLS